MVIRRHGLENLALTGKVDGMQEREGTAKTEISR